MKIVTISEIKRQENKIRKHLAGRDFKDDSLPEEIKRDIKWYKGLIMQYNARALYTACVQPYKDRFSDETITYRDYIEDFEKKRYESISVICMMNPSRINQYWAEIRQNSLSIFSKPVNHSLKNLLLQLNKERDQQLIVGEILDNLEASGMSI